jgi:hypothetical protein
LLETKIYKKTGKFEDLKEEELINELGSFSKIYTKKSMRSHPSTKAEYVFYKGLVKSINVGSRGKPPKRILK